MKNKLIFFYLFLTLSTYSLAQDNKSTQPFCLSEDSSNKSINFKDKKIKNIEVNINNYRKWTENGIKIIIGNFRWIPSKYKKRLDNGGNR